MPELPEVETIRRVIEPVLVGKTITAVQVVNSSIIAYPDADKFAKSLVNEEIAYLGRRGKFLTVYFKSNDRLSLHLRMTGQLLIAEKSEQIEKHTHLIFDLSDGFQIRYVDVRRFGKFWLFKNGEEDNISGQSKLGLEPNDKRLTAEYLKSKLAHKKKAIKEMLHDQTIVAGIGNIYSDEILFSTKIHPNTRCDVLTDKDWETLAKTIPQIISWGIESNAITLKEYMSGKGKEYRNTPYLKVYGHYGLSCPVCHSKIDKLTVAGRTSCFCPTCQKPR